MCSSAPAPDPGIGLAAQQNAAIAKETLDYYKAKDAEMKPYTDKAIQMALDQAQVQTETAKKQNDMADETYQYTKDTFRPLEQKIATDALGYDTAERRDSEAAQAQADIGSAGDAMRTTLAREVASRGGDVNSGNFTAALSNAGVRETAAKAGAGNQARKNVEAVGAAKLADAASLGRNIASTNATQTQLGINAGNSAVGNAQVPGQIGLSQSAAMNGAAGTAIQGNSSSGNLLLGQYQAQNSAGNNSGAWGALGSVAGQALGGPVGGALATKFITSDKNAKKNIKPISGKMSLEAVRKTPVSKWDYKKGRGDSGSHIGPMAQDVKKSLGDASAPGGKKIDLISLNGHTMAAVQQLDKSVTELKKQVVSLAHAKSKARH
jgi:hypothetical protein